MTTRPKVSRSPRPDYCGFGILADPTKLGSVIIVKPKTLRFDMVVVLIIVVVVVVLIFCIINIIIIGVISMIIVIIFSVVVVHYCYCYYYDYSSKFRSNMFVRPK
jgi:hypothetical protein